jgi:dimethylglycine dehydrogenase
VLVPEPTSSSSLKAVVVGAGAYGTSVAFHLLAAGAEVALVDRRPFVTETSPRAAGLAVQVRSLREFGELASRSVLVDFKALTGEPRGVTQTGSVAIARDERAEARVRAHPALAARYGVGVELIGERAAAELAPYASFESARAISYTPTDLYLEPGGLPRAYLAGAGWCRSRGTPSVRSR